MYRWDIVFGHGMVESPLRAKNPSRLMNHMTRLSDGTLQLSHTPMERPLSLIPFNLPFSQSNNQTTPSYLSYIYIDSSALDNQLSQPLNKMAATKTTLILKASDDGQYTVEKSVAEKSGLIKMMIEGE